MHLMFMFQSRSQHCTRCLRILPGSRAFDDLLTLGVDTSVHVFRIVDPVSVVLVLGALPPRRFLSRTCWTSTPSSRFCAGHRAFRGPSGDRSRVGIAKDALEFAILNNCRVPVTGSFLVSLEADMDDLLRHLVGLASHGTNDTCKTQDTRASSRCAGRP